MDNTNKYRPSTFRHSERSQFFMVKEKVNILSTKSMKKVIKGWSKHPNKQTVPGIVPEKWQMTTGKELPTR
jgi:hypothetical protein